MTTTLVTTNLVHIECGNCGVTFGMTRAFIDARKQDHRTWYCPNGHERHYPSESREGRLERELAAAQNAAEREARWRRTAENRAEHERRSAVAYKGHLTRTKRRLVNGVCPCCDHEVPDVAAHLADAHPDYLAPEADN